MNYYNEFDKPTAQWLRNLIQAGLIPQGDVDDRDIREVRASDLRGYEQCHFFAGIGGWLYALQLAGWPTDRPVWTGSCPCQPFSVAGAGLGEKDERHLWPEFHRLIAECRPPTVFGEQVASAAGRKWLSGVRADLENVGYAVGAADLCAAGVGAPHIRQRLFWVANDNGVVSRQRGAVNSGRDQGSDAQPWPGLGSGGDNCGMADSDGDRCDQGRGGESTAGLYGAFGNGAPGGLPDVDSDAVRISEVGECWRGSAAEPVVAGAWDGAIWIPCADGKARRIEPGISPLANGISGRVVRLRGYGNAIVPQVAAKFIVAADLQSNGEKG